MTALFILGNVIGTVIVLGSFILKLFAYRYKLKPESRIGSSLGMALGCAVLEAVNLSNGNAAFFMYAALFFLLVWLVELYAEM